MLCSSICLRPLCALYGLGILCLGILWEFHKVARSLNALSNEHLAFGPFLGDISIHWAQVVQAVQAGTGRATQLHHIFGAQDVFLLRPLHCYPKSNK